jgi:hypothetical protein
MKQLFACVGLAAILFSFTSCQKNFEGDTGPSATGNIIFKFKFDSTQERLNNIGLPAPMPAGHAGLSPKMNVMSAHYVELAPGAFTPLGSGFVLYKAAETTTGGAPAIDFSKAVLTPDGGTFLSYPIKDIPKGEYEYLRVSLAYQNYDVIMHLDTVFSTQAGPVPFSGDFTGTAAAFVGYNTYLGNYTLKTKEVTVNGNKAQGYWGFESNINILGNAFISTSTGQAPAGATTVVNPINSTSPIPPGSCVATGAFKTGKLKITGDEKNDIVVIVSLSINKSFEWIDANGNGKWDVLKGEAVVDMGIRGLIPTVLQ